MFDVGFSEILLVGLISLLVIGPQKLPHVARVVGFWLGKVQRMAATVRQEINAELHAEEVRQMLSQQQSGLLDTLKTQRLELEADAQRIHADIHTALSLTPTVTSPLPVDSPVLSEMPREQAAVDSVVSVAPVLRPPKAKRRRHGKR